MVAAAAVLRALPAADQRQHQAPEQEETGKAYQTAACSTPPSYLQKPRKSRSECTYLAWAGIHLTLGAS